MACLALFNHVGSVGLAGRRTTHQRFFWQSSKKKGRQKLPESRFSKGAVGWNHPLNNMARDLLRHWSNPPRCKPYPFKCLEIYPLNELLFQSEFPLQQRKQQKADEKASYTSSSCIWIQFPQRSIGKAGKSLRSECHAWSEPFRFRSSQAISRTKFKDDVWLEACSECCGKNLPFQKLVFVFLFVHFSPSHLQYFKQCCYTIVGENHFTQRLASTLEDKFITPTCTLHNLPTQGMPDATIAMQHTPEEHQKTTNGKMLVGLVLQKSETNSCL